MARFTFPFLLLLSLTNNTVLAEDKQEQDPTFILKHKGETREIKASDNPALKKLYDQLQEKLDKQAASDAPEEVVEEETIIEPEKPAFDGNKSTAESAYRSDDYETAYEHYKALSAQGDAEASMKLAAMHSRGEGVDKDETLAYAYFARAAEQGDDIARELMGSTRFSDDQRTAIEEEYTKISEEIDEPEKAEKAAENFAKTESSYSSYRGIGTPKSVGFDFRTDPKSIQNKTYVQRVAKNYDRSPSKTYNRSPAKSYARRGISIKKFKNDGVENTAEN